MGIDGCGFPAPTMPLLNLGLAVARFAKPSDLSDDYAQAILRIQQAIIQEPLYAAGHGTVVSELNQVTKGKVLAKKGQKAFSPQPFQRKALGLH